MSSNDTVPENPAAPSWLNNGDNAWQLTAGSLVALQSIPGLAILYAGWVKHKWAINSAFMVFYAFAAVLVCWTLWAYKAAFGNRMLPFVGKPGTVLTMDYELQQSTLPAYLGTGVQQAFPQATMVYFQFVFAAITLVITAGSFLCRMSFLAWMVYVPLWLTFSYTVVAFSIWGGGFLTDLGILDYSGGYVIHLSSGTAGFVGAWWIGPRIKEDLDDFQPNNVLLMLVGTGILWVGWNGFNGGDPYTASPDAGAAVLNTNLCTAVSMLTWVLLDYFYFKRPAVIGAVQGIITGLVAITPAAGFVAGWGAIIIGLASGSVPWVTLNLGKRNLSILQHVDDTLDVFHTHLIASLVGGFFTGLFATQGGTSAFGAGNAGGAIARNGHVVWVQIVGALFVIGWNVVWVSLIMCFIKYVLRIPLRMSDAQCMVGDYAVHEEESYTFAYFNRSLIPKDMDLESGVIEGKDVPESPSRVPDKVARYTKGTVSNSAPSGTSSDPANGRSSTEVEPKSEIAP